MSFELPFWRVQQLTTWPEPDRCILTAGKRTFGGLIDDGLKSGMRYILNNFFDGHKQDALDLLTGTYTIKKGGLLLGVQLFCSLPLHAISLSSAPILSALWIMTMQLLCTGMALNTDSASALADGPSPFKPSVNGLILIAVALLLFLKAMVSLFRTTVSVCLPLCPSACAFSFTCMADHR